MRLTAAILVMAAMWAGQLPAAGTPNPQRKVIIVVADTAAWQDYTSPAAPFMRQWLRECAVGLMNARVANYPTPPAAYLTLGAGSRVSARLDPELAALALNHDESLDGLPAPEVFRARTGRALRPHRLAYFGLPSIAAENFGALYPLRLGLLGEALADAGLPAAAIGNADLPHAYRRQIVTIVMNEAGVARAGDIGPAMYSDAPRFEPPLMTNYAALLAALKGTLTQAAVVAVETGDLPRIAERSLLMTPERVQQERATAVRRMDRFMRELVSSMQNRPWRLYLVSPSGATQPEQPPDVLTPIVAYGEGVTPGLLTSSSTRRPGIVANTDLAASVLDFLRIAVPPDTMGRAIRVSPAPVADPLARVIALEQREERMEANRPSVVKGISGLVAAVWLVIAAALLLFGPLPRGVTVGLRQAALAVLALPLAALVLPASVVASPGALLILLFAVAGVCYGAAKLLGCWGPPWAWLTGAFAVVLCADVAWRQTLVQRSVLSYSTSVGARYYGLGNELGGALLAAAPLAIAGWLGARRPSPARRLAAAVILACVVVVIGHPAMGADIGNALPAALGFGLMVLGLYHGRIGGRQVLVAALVALAAVAAVAGGDWLVGGQGRSHIGLAVEAIRRGGTPEMFAMIARKSALNWLLVRHSVATWVLGSALAAIAGVTLGRMRAVSEQVGVGSPLGAALVGASAAAAAAFFLNDSGVLAAAWGFTVVASVLVYVALDWLVRQGAAPVLGATSRQRRASPPRRASL